MAKTDQKIVETPKHEHENEIRSIIGHSGDLFYKLTWKILMMESSRTEPTAFCIHNKLAKRKSYH